MLFFDFILSCLLSTDFVGKPPRGAEFWMVTCKRLVLGR